MSGARTERIPSPAEVRQIVTDLDARLTDVEGRIAEATWTEDSEDGIEHFQELSERARSDWTILDKAAERALRAADAAGRHKLAWEKAASDVDRIAGQIQTDLDTILAELRVHHLGDFSPPDAWRAVAESWRARVDELRVQANLARREMQDQAHENVDRVESAVDALRTGIEDTIDGARREAGGMAEPGRSLLHAARAVARETGQWLVEHSGPSDGADQDDGDQVEAEG
jgi:hypothetical protein